MLAVVTVSITPKILRESWTRKILSYPWEDINPAHTSVLDFKPPEFWINKILLFKPAWFVVFYYSSPSKLIYLPSQLLDLTPACLSSHLLPSTPQALQSSHVHLLQILQMCYVRSCFWGCAQIALSTWNIHSPAHFPLGDQWVLEDSAQSPFFCFPHHCTVLPPSQTSTESTTPPQMYLIYCLSRSGLLLQPLPAATSPRPHFNQLHMRVTWQHLSSARCLPLTSWPRPSLMPRLEHPQKPTGHTHGPIRWHAGEITLHRLLTDKVSPLSLCRQFWLTFHKAPRKFQWIDHQWMQQGPTPKASVYSSSFLLPCFTPCPSPTSDPWNQVRHCVYFVLRWMKLYEIANIDHSWPTKMPVSYDLMIICLLFSNRM